MNCLSIRATASRAELIFRAICSCVMRTALEFVPEDFHIRQVRVEYKKAAVLHDQLYPFIYKDDQIIKILLGDAEGQAYAVVEFKR